MTIRIVEGPDLSPPTVTPLKSSVLDHAKVVVESGSFGLRNDNEGHWPSYHSGSEVLSMGFKDCGTEAKEFNTAPWAPGFVFVRQTGWRCNPVGLDVAQMTAEAKRVFEATEGRAVERAIAQAIADGLLDTEGVGTTPAGSLEMALALLEGSAAATYAGQPTIHSSRFAASLLNDRIVWEGGKAFTRLGSKVAIGGGYDEETPDDSPTLFATGEVFVEKSEQIDITSYVVPGDGSGDRGSAEGGGIEDNTVLVLAERMYRVIIDPINDDGTPVLTVTASL